MKDVSPLKNGDFPLPYGLIEEILHQLRLVVLFPIIYKVLYISSDSQVISRISALVTSEVNDQNADVDVKVCWEKRWQTWDSLSECEGKVTEANAWIQSHGPMDGLWVWIYPDLSHPPRNFFHIPNNICLFKVSFLLSTSPFCTTIWGVFWNFFHASCANPRMSLILRFLNYYPIPSMLWNI